MNIAPALEMFNGLMYKKFYDRVEKWGEDSITIPGNINKASMESIKDYFDGELEELVSATNPEDEMGECVDVANMAFLIWWKNYEDGYHGI